MGTQVLVPFRGSEDSHRHLKLMGDLGQVHSLFFIFFISGFHHSYSIAFTYSDCTNEIQPKR